MRIDWRIAQVAVVGLLTTGGLAHADTWSTPIGVPRTGAEGPASAYPASLNVVALGGPTQIGQIRVELHAVTHDCPEDLAVLLVHNNTDKYLLMSNAGGCRPLQGTSIRFAPTATALPNSEPASPPHDGFIEISPSNYGVVPTFPPFAPPGPYTLAMPPANTNINGTWDLYVLDNHAGNRGVINGWSLLYDTSPPVPATSSNVSIPAVGTGPGGAENYPVTFDLTTVSDAARVSFIDLRLHLSHTNPENLRMLLESPSGTSVVLMANAGGTTDLDPGTLLRFVQNA